MLISQWMDRSSGWGRGPPPPQEKEEKNKKKKRNQKNPRIATNTTPSSEALKRHLRAFGAVLAHGGTFLVVGRGAFAVFDVGARQSAGVGCSGAEGCPFGEGIGGGLGQGGRVRRGVRGGVRGRLGGWLLRGGG